MKLSTFSMFVVSILTFSNVSFLVDGQIRRRHGHARLLEEIAGDPQESVLLEEPALLMEDMEWSDFSMELSTSMSMSMMLHGSTKKSSTGPKGMQVKGSKGPIITGADGSIPEIVASDGTIDQPVLLKRSYIEDTRGAMKLFKS